MPGKGFLIRGTLAPALGSTTGAGRDMGGSSPFRAVGQQPVNKGKLVVGQAPIVQNNRIPSSLSLRKNNGAR